MYWILIFIFILIIILIIKTGGNITGGNITGGGELSLSVQEPWLSLIKSGRKKVEGRSGKLDKFKHWIGKEVLFYNNTNNLKVKVLDVRHYNTLYEYLDSEKWHKVAPHLSSYQEVVNNYHKFYSDFKIEKNGGMNAIEITTEL